MYSDTLMYFFSPQVFLSLNFLPFSLPPFYPSFLLLPLLLFLSPFTFSSLPSSSLAYCNSFSSQLLVFFFQHARTAIQLMLLNSPELKTIVFCDPHFPPLKQCHTQNMLSKCWLTLSRLKQEIRLKFLKTLKYKDHIYIQEQASVRPFIYKTLDAGKQTTNIFQFFVFSGKKIKNLKLSSKSKG